jgi:hypothetical protein
MEPQTSTSQPSVTTKSSGIRFGLISGIISIVYFLILSVAGIDMTSGIWNWMGYIILIALIFLAHKHYKENGDGFMNYPQGISIGVWMGMISSAISGIFTYLYIKFIDSTFLENIKDKQIEEMEKKGMSDEDIETAMKFASMFTSAEAILIFAIIGGIVGAVIVALIVTIFTQKKRPEQIF